MQAPDNDPPTFDVYIYVDEESCGEEDYDQLLETIQLEYNTVTMVGSEYPNIMVSFKEFLTYDEAKNIMFWFYDRLGDCVDGWGTNYDIDDRLLDIRDDWLKER